MKGDFTRLTFQSKNRYTGVYMQQGRLQMDSDWNEQVEIQKNLIQTYAQDFIGGSARQGSGVPGQLYDSQNFSIRIDNFSKQDFIISHGHIYVNGILCELDEDRRYSEQFQPRVLQPDLTKQDLDPTKEDTLKSGDYIAYLDVWERHLTLLDEPSMAEVALNGIDTSTRTQTVWQVKLLAADETAKVDEAGDAGEDKWLTFLRKNQNRQTYLTATATGKLPLENHLYRIEIHKGGTREEAKFKWSRDNGSVAFAVTQIKDGVITVNSRGRDISQILSPGEWIEVIDEFREKNNQPGTLVQLSSVVATSLQGGKLIIAQDPNATINTDNFPLSNESKTGVKVRRWDYDPNQQETALYSIDGSINEKVTLDAEIEIEFEDTSFEEYTLEIISAESADDLPTKGNRSIVVAKIDSAYHVCIFNRFGNKVIDKGSSEFSLCEKLAGQLNEACNNQSLNDQQKRCLISKLTSSVGYSLYEYKAGDYWLLPVRANLQSPEWSGKTLASNGIRHHYLKLASAYFDGTSFEPEKEDKKEEGDKKIPIGFWRDERVVFPSLTQCLNKDAAEGLKKVTRLSIGSSSSSSLATLDVQAVDSSLPDGALIYADPSDSNTVLVKGFSPLDALEPGGSIVVNGQRGNITEILPDTYDEFKVDVDTGDLGLEKGEAQAKIFQYQLPIARFGTGKTQVTITPLGKIKAQGLELPGTASFEAGTFIGEAFQFHQSQPEQSKVLFGSVQVSPIAEDKQIRFTANQDVNFAFLDGNVTIKSTQPESSVQLEVLGNVLGSQFIGDGSELTHITASQVGALESIAGVTNPGGNIALVGSEVINITSDDEQNRITITENHSINCENPHGVTAKQIGALTHIAGVPPNSEGNIDVVGSEAITITPDDTQNRITITENHSIDRENPHGVTVDQVLDETDGVIERNLTFQGQLEVNNNVIIGRSPETMMQRSTNLYVNGQILTGSSRQMKDNVAALSSQDVAGLLQGLTPIKYSYKADQDNKLHAGFIAEDVPDLVASDDRSAISATDIVAILTKAVQDQRQTTMVLADIVEQQQQVINQVQEKIRRLEEASENKSSWFR